MSKKNEYIMHVTSSGDAYSKGIQIIERLEEENRKLKAFANDYLAWVEDENREDATVMDLMERNGLIDQVKRMEPCQPGCVCDTLRFFDGITEPISCGYSKKEILNNVE